MAKKRIAILGGGAASLSAAWYLTRTPKLRARHDVTVYQMGWRLGGQGASGRNREHGDRIEEHGLHLWLGFYENAFATVRDCYAEIPDDPLTPLRDWTDAFKPGTYTPIGLDGGQRYARIEWPTNADMPGDGRLLLTPWGAITEGLGILSMVVKQLLSAATRRREWLHLLLLPFVIVWRLVKGVTRDVVHPRKGVAHATRKTWGILRTLPSLVSSRPANAGHGLTACAQRAGQRAIGLGGDLEWIMGEVALFFLESVEWFVHRTVDPKGHGGLLFQVLDTATATLRGLLNPEYDLLSDWNLDRIDDYEFCDWLVRNGARKTIQTVPRLRDAPELRGFYDLAFGYRPDLAKGLQPDFAAGAAVRATIRILTMYKGALFFEMQAGMGEAVMAPIYRVLKQRGVTFKFFHKVTRLELSENRNWVQRIHINRQVRLVQDTYEPLYRVRGLPCWPSEPFWEQIEDGAAIRQRLRDAKCTLESHWCHESAGTCTLELGVDFDWVVLGLNIGALAALNDADESVCGELMEAHEPFRQMVKHLGVIPTFAVQLWMRRSLRGLGWTTGRPDMDGAVEPMDVWADMSQLLPREDWPVSGAPRSIQYFCGSLNTELHRRPARDTAVPREAHEAVRTIATQWLSHNPKTIWPDAELPGSRALDWSLLYDPGGETGPGRIESQWLRANVDPTECVASAWHGTTKYRLASDASGFENLVLAGTWVSNGMQSPNVETAFMTGMAASRAICGEPATIVGEWFLRQPRAPTP